MKRSGSAAAIAVILAATLVPTPARAQSIEPREARDLIRTSDAVFGLTQHVPLSALGHVRGTLVSGYVRERSLTLFVDRYLDYDLIEPLLYGSATLEQERLVYEVTEPVVRTYELRRTGPPRTGGRHI